MASGKHTPPGDRSFLTSVTRHIAAGVALVAVVAGAFWGIGQLRTEQGGDPVIQAADGATSPSPQATGTSTSPAETAPSPAPATPNADETPSPSETATTGPTPEPTSQAPAQTEPTGEAAQLAPSEISIQVLDAAADGGGRAEDAAGRLRADGYDVVATNRAVREYTTTTLMYSPGHEAEARQLASAYPEFSNVEPKPDNLSDSVDVHVVIGSDYPG